MKKIKIKDYIELEVREAKCDFCGEVSECVKGSHVLEIPNLSPITVRALKDKDSIGRTKMIHNLYDLKYGFFGKGRYDDVEGKCESIYKAEDLEYKSLYEMDGNIENTIDICKNCIKQLAKLV